MSGLDVLSDLPLPGEPAPPGGDPEVTVARAQVPADLPCATMGEVNWVATDDTLLLRVPGVVAF
jgi:hypothetical protein